MSNPASLEEAMNDDGLTPNIASILSHKAFVELRQKRGGLATRLSVAMLVIYYGFILLIAFAPKFLATPVIGIVSLGIVLGLGVILASIALTGIYVMRANKEFDHLTLELHRSVK